MATCPMCGANRAEASVFCTSCGARIQGAAGVPAPAAVAPARYASIFRRAIALLVDLLPLVAFGWFAGVSAASRYGGWGPDGGYSMQPLPYLAAMAKALAAWLVYFVCCEWWFGATLGKCVLGAGVTALDGSRANVLQIAARNVLRIVDAFPFGLVGVVLMLLSKQRQRLGDRVARTVVALRRPPAAVRTRALVASLALPFFSLGATWSLGLFDAASNRWMSDASTRLHGEGRYKRGLAGYIDLGAGKSTVHTETEAYASGAVLNETLILDAVQFSAAQDGSRRRGAAFKPGELVAVRFNLTGIAGANGSSSGRLRTRVRVLGPNGTVVVPATNSEDDVAAGPDRVVPREVRFGVPSTCPAGKYHVEIEIQDLVAAGRELNAKIPFTVL